MELIFEFFFELIIEICFEALDYAAKNRKNKKRFKRFLAITAAVLIILFYAAIILLLIFVGISAFKDNIGFSILAFIFAIIVMAAFIINFRKVSKKHKNSKNPEN